MDELYITLYDEKGQELSYQVEHIFDVDGEEQLYCSAFPAGGGDIIFLRCSLTENGETTEVTIEDIPDATEYGRVADAYLKKAEQAAIEEAREELSQNEDYITVSDADGNQRDFIIHTIFDDEESHRSYIAVQEVTAAGEIVEEISLYRFNDDGPSAVMDMIPSDMEYERARNLFIKLIETV